MTKKKTNVVVPQSQRNTQVWALPALIVIVLFAASLRFFRIDVQSYWHDEGNSRVLSGRSAGDIWLAAAVDIHPPGYYLVLSGWRSVFGESEASLRGLSALAGALAAGVIFDLARRRFGLVSGLVAGGFMALDPFLVYYGQEARMYALLVLWTVLTFYCADWLEDAPWPLRATPDRLAAVGYMLALTAGLYTHYAFGFVVVAQALLIVYALVRGPGSARWLALIRLGLLALSGLLFAPWIPTALHQLSTWPADRNGSMSPLDLVRWLGFGGTILSSEAQLGLAALGAAIAFGVIAMLALRPEATRLGRSALVWLLVPAVSTLALGLLTPSFAKFLVVAVPALALLVSVTYDVREQPQDARRWVRPGMAGLLLLAVTATMVTSLNHLYFDPAYARDDYRGIAQYLRDRQVPSDAVIVIAPNQMEAFGYYYGDQPGDVTVAPLPTTRPLGVEQTRAQLEDLLETHDRLWVLFWAQQQADPDGLVERWLADNAYATGDRWFGAVRLASYGTAPTGAREPSGALFGDDIALVDSALSGNRAAPGDVISVSLRWQAARVPTADYKVFIHLAISPDVPPVAQHDSTPANGFAPTSGWAANITVDDHHGLQLPADLAPGTYQLLVGLTDPQGTRLMVDGANAVGQDRVSIGTITVP